MNGWLGIVGTGVTVLGVIVTAVLTYRGSRTAAAIAAGPAEKQNEFAVLQATVARVDKENEGLRLRQSRLESVVRAFAWSFDDLRRWSRHPVGPPPDPHPLVDEYNRTGV